MTSAISEATRKVLWFVTDVVSDHPVLLSAGVLGAVAGGVYFYRKKNKPPVTDFERAHQERATAPKPAPAQQFHQKPQQATQKPVDEERAASQGQDTNNKEEPPKPQEKTQEEKDAATMENDNYTVDPHELSKRPKIAKIVEAFEARYAKEFPVNLAEACEEVNMAAHQEMADLANGSKGFTVSQMRHDDFLNVSKQTNPSARLSKQFSNFIHSSRTFKAANKAEAKLLLAMLATSVARDCSSHHGREARGVTEAIALIDECYAHGATDAFFYETVVSDATDERDRKLVAHQVRVLIEVDETRYAIVTLF